MFKPYGRLMGIKILIADEQQGIRTLVHALVQPHPDLIVVGEVGDSQEAVRQTVRLCPDVVILDLAMPKLDGLWAARRIRELSPLTQIVLFSLHSRQEYVVEALHIGVQAYVLKTSAGNDLIEAIRTVHARTRYLSPKLVFELGNALVGSLLS